MIKSKEELKFFLLEDAIRNDASKLHIVRFFKRICGIENECICHYLRLLRKCEFYSNKSNIIHRLLFFFYKFRYKRYGLKHNVDIPINVCGYGLRIMHISGGGGVLINATKVGNYCGFNSGVLIGNKDSVDARPTIGDHVAFGPGAKAFGNINIGNNVFVAANSVVTKDIHDNCIVGGIPAKVIKVKNNEKNNMFHNFIN